jgi:hypothetical protein
MCQLDAPKIPGEMELDGKRNLLLYADDVNTLGENSSIN